MRYRKGQPPQICFHEHLLSEVARVCIARRAAACFSISGPCNCPTCCGKTLPTASPWGVACLAALQCLRVITYTASGGLQQDLGSDYLNNTSMWNITRKALPTN